MLINKIQCLLLLTVISLHVVQYYYRPVYGV